ncbi:hypothetical protein, partial [Pseudomonas syringae group sp. J309-1]|uniref:hypothetical protein n=1 Tax=Pseudomonas syringae group sp. J309-1 TaxID=3079588 RepID=UPI00290C2124
MKCSSVGAVLARDKGNSVPLQNRGVCIAGKPGSHRRKRSPVKATLAATVDFREAIALPAHNPVGAGLACDKGNSVPLQNRGVCIAGKPGSHRRKRSPVKATLAATADFRQAISLPAHNPVGAGLARDKGNSVQLQNRGVCIAVQPGSPR